MRRCSKLLAAVAFACGVVPTQAEAEDVAPAEQPALAVMGTIPIYWGEAADIDEVLSGAAHPHWARARLERQFALAPLDYLSAANLAPHQRLLLAQPRGLSGEENVALDAWVRNGGRLILFADPMMSGESRFHIGDRRRPQDVSLLSPILGHWGLELHYDDSQPEGLVEVDHFGDSLPANQRGELRSNGEVAYCSIPGDGLLAHCVIGAGQAMIVADAAMLDIDGPYPHSESALDWLTGHIFGEFGDEAGIAAESPPEAAVSGRNTDASDHRAHNGGHEEHGSGGQ